MLDLKCSVERYRAFLDRSNEHFRCVVDLAGIDLDRLSYLVLLRLSDEERKKMADTSLPAPGLSASIRKLT